MKSLARVVLTLLIVAAGCAGGYELWDYYMLSPWTRDARVQADVVTIAPDLAGFVDEVRVKDNQSVRKGDVLFVIDRARYERALWQAQHPRMRYGSRCPTAPSRRPLGHIKINERGLV